MGISRMDLADAGSPSKLVQLILKAEPGLTLPVPIEQLALQLDILEIKDLETEGFEGGLIADEAKSAGYILVNRDAVKGRRRFTIGHELGHFLIPSHKPKAGAQFMCSRADMRRWDRADQNAYFRMEFEANEFAALLLMPPPLLRSELAKFRDPDLSQVTAIARTFEVSKEAAARAFATYHDEPVAIVISKDGKIDKVYRNLTRFPRMSVWVGQPVPQASQFHKASRAIPGPSALNQVGAAAWLESEWGKPLPELFEQVLLQQSGYALILLWAELPEEEEVNDERTAKERYRDRMAGR